MGKSRILLVDDDENDIFLTRKSLESKNYDVTSVTSVIEALQQIATQSFDILMTDLHMPNPGDGYAVVTAMRHTQPKVLTLVVSGYPDGKKR
jgi:CheY-like chemotaxis protein